MNDLEHFEMVKNLRPIEIEEQQEEKQHLEADKNRRDRLTKSGKYWRRLE